MKDQSSPSAIDISISGCCALLSVLPFASLPVVPAVVAPLQTSNGSCFPRGVLLPVLGFVHSHECIFLSITGKSQGDVFIPRFPADQGSPGLTSSRLQCAVYMALLRASCHFPPRIGSWGLGTIPILGETPLFWRKPSCFFGTLRVFFCVCVCVKNPYFWWKTLIFWW